MSVHSNEFGDGLRVKPKALFCDHGDKAGAGFEVGIVKLAIALVLLEMGGISPESKKRSRDDRTTM